MRKERMTVEELNSLNPSYENQVKMVCDDGVFTSYISEVMVFSQDINGRFAVIDKNGYIDSIHEDSLVHFPSLKPEKKRWFQLYVSRDDGSIFMADSLCCENFLSTSGQELFYGHKKALGREVTEEIENLEWK